MITGFTGLDLGTLVGAVRRSRASPPPQRGLQPVPGLDTVQFSARGHRLADAGEGGSFAGRRAAFHAAVSTGSGVAAQFRGARVGQTVNHPDGGSFSRVRAVQAAVVPAGDGVAVIRSARAVNVARGPQGTAVATYQAVQSVSIARPGGNDGVEATRPFEESSLMQRMKASFFSRAGDARFDASLDLNGDGTINHADLAAMRQAEKPGRPQDLLGQMQNALFTRSGDDRYSAGADVNNDGAVNFADLAMLRAKLDSAASNARPGSTPATPPADAVELSAGTSQTRVNPDQHGAATVESVRNAFFSSSGDAAFAAAADLNGDGRVDFADLAELRERNQQA